MILEAKDIILGLLSLFAAGISLFAKELWSTQKELQKELSALKEELPNKYVPKDDFKTFRTEVLSAIGKLDEYVRETIRPTK